MADELDDLARSLGMPLPSQTVFADDAPRIAESKRRIAANSRPLTDSDPEGRGQTGPGANVGPLRNRALGPGGSILGTIGRTEERAATGAAMGLKHAGDAIRTFSGSPAEIAGNLAMGGVGASDPVEEAAQQAFAGSHPFAYYGGMLAPAMLGGPEAGAAPAGASRLGSFLATRGPQIAYDAAAGATLGPPGERMMTGATNAVGGQVMHSVVGRVGSALGSAGRAGKAALGSFREWANAGGPEVEAAVSHVPSPSMPPRSQLLLGGRTPLPESRQLPGRSQIQMPAGEGYTMPQGGAEWVDPRESFVRGTPAQYPPVQASSPNYTDLLPPDAVDESWTAFPGQRAFETDPYSAPRTARPRLLEDRRPIRLPERNPVTQSSPRVTKTPSTSGGALEERYSAGAARERLRGEPAKPGSTAKSKPAAKASKSAKSKPLAKATTAAYEPPRPSVGVGAAPRPDPLREAE